MNTTGALAIGLVVGAALGFGAAQLLHNGPSEAPSPERGETLSHEACRAREEALLGEVDRLRGSSPKLATAGIVPDAGVPETHADAAPAPTEDAFRAIVVEARGKVAAIRESEPGSDALLALIKEWRAILDAEDERMRALGTWILKHLAATGKLRPGDVDAFVADFRSLPSGSPARPGLAAAVTQAFANDARLADWFRDLPTVEEPEVREQAVWALDESPSAALRDYVLKLSREETNADVLNSIWNEDIILVCLTRESAPKLIEAISGRVAQGDLPPKVRGRAYFAIGLAATHSPAAAKAAVDGMLASEKDAGVRAFGEGVGQAMEREESNVQALEGLWDQHAPGFGE